MKRAVAFIAATLILGGCAKNPPGAIGGNATRLVVTMRVDGKFRTGAELGGGLPYIYMVAFRLSDEVNPTTQGPIPVVAPPWGNGFVAGNATHFVWWDPNQVSPVTIYRFRDASLNEYTALGVPINTIVPAPNGNELKFEIGLDQLEPDATLRGNLRTVQVNFLTMDRIAQTGNNKFWDALGDGRLPSQVNTWINVPITVGGTFNNARSGDIEPRGDQPDPDLDLVNWEIEVRPQ